MKTKSTTATATRKSAPKKPELLFVGLDLGTNTSCLMVSEPGARKPLLTQQIPTVVGYAREGILAGILPGGVNVLFGQEALRHKLHLRLVNPLRDGIVDDVSATRDFLLHIHALIDGGESTELRAVVGVPANATAEARESIRRAAAGIFDKVIMIPEPFLAALGFRDEGRLDSANYVDPVRNSLYIDIGAGSTDICRIQGYYPTSEEQVSTTFAGDRLDTLVRDAILQAYPDSCISLAKAREIKEAHSSMVDGDDPVYATVIIGGKARKLSVGTQVRAACRQLLEEVFHTTRTLIARADPDSVPVLLQNIILTGGGSLIKGFGVALQTMLLEEGFDAPRVTVLGDNYKEYVARGALKAATAAQERQWQHVLR
ncbi:MAG: hypothetical protein EA425_01870 [Puniceicoccaceae bacterium]|nr:MAG: hypothetical protein EA425_01870 [Puniceicoccaceae bacterium]